MNNKKLQKKIELLNKIYELLDDTLWNIEHTEEEYKIKINYTNNIYEIKEKAQILLSNAIQEQKIN